MNELALFAGAGGGILAGHLLGWCTVCAVERDPYAASVLMQRQNDGILKPFPVWDDVCTFDGRPWRGIVDVVSGGFPCQDISVAGRGKGLDGERSGLWAEMARIIGEVRPRFVFVENSPMLAVRGGVRVIAELAAMGFSSRWGTMGAYTTGSCADGKRLWIVAHAPDCFRMDTPQIPRQIIDTKESSRRQFERAVCSAISDEEHARNLGNTDAMAAAMDRLKAIGNGQDPILAKLAWETLSV